MDGNDIESNLGISRRTLIKRGALVGGTLVWAAPAVQTLSRAGAAGSPGCDAKCVDVVCKCTQNHHQFACKETSCDPTDASLKCICGCRTDPGFPNCHCPHPVYEPDETTCVTVDCGPGTTRPCSYLPACP